MGGRLEFEFRVPKPTDRPRAVQAEGEAFRILIVGDFRGSDARRAAPVLADRPVMAVDIDNYEQILARLAPRVSIVTDAPGGDGEELVFTALDDFHPDTLFTKPELFADLRQLREDLQDPARFEAAAAALTSGTAQTEKSGTVKYGDRETAAEDTGAMIERLLGGRPVTANSGPSSRGADHATRLIERLVEPEIERGADPDRQRLLVAAVDSAIAERMRRVLHDPAFQKLESAWRGLWWLVSSLETGADLQIHMLDAGRDELAADLEHAGDGIETTAIYRKLVGGDADTPGGQAWSLLLGLDRFGMAERDLRLLAALGAVAAHADGPFVAEGEPSLLGADSIAGQPDPADWAAPEAETEQRWLALRRASVAPWLGLALPRVLLRLPYGSRSDPVEAFAFEEVTAAGDHESYLWGSPALACALLLGRSFLGTGWNMAPGDQLDLDDLPAVTLSEHGETRLMPCAEALLSHRTADAMMARGLMPVLSHSSRNAVRFARIQSIADPPAALSGPWR